MPLNRTFLFAPGNHPRRVEKALALAADAVILDLEDAVAISDKAAARKPVAEALKGPRRCRGYVRPNAPSSPFCYRDLVETIHDRVDGVVLPKVIVPLNPGKNLTVISEVVAMAHLLRMTGVDVAAAFNDRLIRRMMEQRGLKEYLQEDYE